MTKLRTGRREVALSALAVLISIPAVSQQLTTLSANPTTVPLSSSYPLGISERVNHSGTFGKLPLQFEKNLGQTASSTRYMARGSGYTLFLTGNEAVIKLNAGSGSNSVLHMKLASASANPTIAGINQLSGTVNYLIGNQARNWKTNVSAFGKVRYSSVYPGVDLVYYGNQSQLEYDFVVAAGANPRKIGLSFSGAHSLKIQRDGSLLLGLPGGSVSWKAPAAYQLRNGVRQTVAARYKLTGNNSVGFELAKYDSRLPLIIDPTLVYSTYLGGTGGARANGIATDGSGNIYITGVASSADFPTTSGAFQTTSHGNGDVFVSKISSDGTTLIYSTYLGGAGSDTGNAIAVSATGEAYVGGNTLSSDFPISTGAWKTIYKGGAQGDGFVAKLSNDGTRLVYSTYLGGSSNDTVNAIALNAAGNAYVTGSTNSAAFPTTTGAYKRNFGGGASDVFVTELTVDGSNAVYSTFLGGNGVDEGHGIVVNANGVAYVTGHTTVGSGTTFPTTAGVAQTTAAGGREAFVTAFAADGKSLVFSTLFGGTGDDEGHAIALDSTGNIYITGSTTSTGLTGVAQKNNGGGLDAFVASFPANGTKVLNFTYLGGSGDDNGLGIAIAPDDSVVVGGNTRSSNFPVTPNASQIAYGGGAGGDGFIVKLSRDHNAVTFATYLGGTSDDSVNAVASYHSQTYVAGSTSSTNFPVTAKAIQKTGNTNGVAFVSRVQPYAKYDLNGDGHPDILFRNVSNGLLMGWMMNGRGIVDRQYIHVPDTRPFDIVGLADMDGDGSPDLVLQQKNGAGVYVLYLKGLNLVRTSVFRISAGPAWRIVGIADFDGDGILDLLVQSTDNAWVAVLKSTGGSVYIYPSAATYPNILPMSWKVIGTGDFSGNGHPDILLQDQLLGFVAVWSMNGTTLVKSTYLTSVFQDWNAFAAVDYLGDGHTGVLLQRKSTSGFYYMPVNNLKVGKLMSIYEPFGSDWVISGLR